MAVIYTALPAHYAPLRQGSAGPDVSQVQTWLNGVRSAWPALETLTVDGKFGPATARNVRLFQTANGLSADGVVGKNTWDALYSRHADQQGAGEIYPGTALRPGDTGATVKSAQSLLQATSPTLTVDGRFGANTQRATQLFQSAQGLTTDGIIGRNTWNALHGKT